MLDRVLWDPSPTPAVDAYWLIRQFAARIKKDAPPELVKGWRRVHWESNTERVNKAVRQLGNAICFRKVRLEMELEVA